MIILLGLLAATYWPTPTISWPPPPNIPEWPTATQSWIDPYTDDPEPEPTKHSLTKGELAAIISCSIIGVIVIAVAAFFIIRNVYYKKIVESALCPDPLV